MSLLHDLQGEFAAALREAASLQSITAAIHETPGPDAAARLGIYRNNMGHGHRAALAATYPVVEQLVGADFFARLAGDFINQHPPGIGPLLDWGGELGPFLDVYPPVETLPYLGDVARLEWACHEAFYSADAAALDPAALAAVPASLLADVVFRLHPAVRMLSSNWPVAAIWMFHQDGGDDGSPIDLQGGGDAALITRPGRDVVMRRLTGADHIFFTRLGHGEAVGAAYAATITADADFNLAGALQVCLESGALRHFYIQDKNRQDKDKTT